MLVTADLTEEEIPYVCVCVCDENKFTREGPEN